MLEMKLDKIIKILDEINERLDKLENKDKKINIVTNSRILGSRPTRSTIKLGGR
ncbi:hypothetical protein [Clostridium estertheticum]|uniref:Uncharacterized protein n=1 Tax=Clostridium estertheticum TaxID=238834 RepID=A0AA47I7T6_9CLOT|nr:hypothetical protein [Clostridium estertheticum]MBU3153916.1 hypothetical protein [Clostridium estertheticum]WAG61310.1 hypothetical protein LL038_03390 [Clostridium estertheticum]